MTEATFVGASAFGDADMLALQRESLGACPPGHVRVRQAAVGVNFIDVLLRRGDLGGTAPLRLGLEAAGHVEAVGDGAVDVRIGERVAYAGGPPGAYATVRDVPAGRVVTLPDEIAADQAAALLFKGLTADYLVHRLRPLEAGDWVLFHAATGGVGSLAIPWLTEHGVRVIGAIGSPEKTDAARALGCEHVLVLAPGDQSEHVRAWSGGGVRVAYDSIGRATFETSLRSLARFGLLVSFGWASGEVEPLALSRLREQGSVFVTRPTVAHYTDHRDDLLAGSARVFEAARRGIIATKIDARIPLTRAADAHRLLERGGHRGQVLLVPG